MKHPLTLGDRWPPTVRPPGPHTWPLRTAPDPTGGPLWAAPLRPLKRAAPRADRISAPLGRPQLLRAQPFLTALYLSPIPRKLTPGPHIGRCSPWIHIYPQPM